MSLDLERHLVFYGAYHHNSVNVGIHMMCVPIILFSGFLVVRPNPLTNAHSFKPTNTILTQAANSGTVIPLPDWLTIPYLPLNLCTIGAILWGGLYVLLEPVAGTALALICLGAAAADNYMFSLNPKTATQWAIAVHVVCWVAQFVGHGKYEGRAPALLDNLLQAIFLAPLFVWLELLFMLGYRQELQSRVNKEVHKELEKFRANKAAKNGKAQ